MTFSLVHRAIKKKKKQHSLCWPHKHTADIQLNTLWCVHRPHVLIVEYYVLHLTGSELEALMNQAWLGFLTESLSVQCTISVFNCPLFCGGINMSFMGHVYISLGTVLPHSEPLSVCPGATSPKEPFVYVCCKRHG